MRKAVAFIGLGSNIPPRLGRLRRAVRGLAALPETSLSRVSPVYETSALGPPQKDFLNAAAALRTRLTPQKLLAELLALEKRLGRRRRKRWGPREIDLDILFYAKRRLSTRYLALPHPEVRRRKFVLFPLRDLAPMFRDPVTGKSVSRLLAELTAPSQKVRLYRRNWLYF
jgi:2-amino-4-hydroxy-6-hydroxymethyldihydropteridine diphosphokinase